jgi:hypothetical protein
MRRRPAPAQPTAAERETFVALSSALTGFAPIELEGTGNIAGHLALLWTVIGPDICRKLLTTARMALAQDDEQARTQAIETTIWNAPDIGPVAQALVRLWYTGKWNPLPAEWQETYRWDHPDPHAAAVNASPQGYVEALVWTAIGAHPPGAKPTGHGSWSYPPPAAPAGVRLHMAAEAGHDKQRA